MLPAILVTFSGQTFGEVFCRWSFSEQLTDDGDVLVTVAKLITTVHILEHIHVGAEELWLYSVSQCVMWYDCILWSSNKRTCLLFMMTTTLLLLLLLTCGHSARVRASESDSAPLRASDTFSTTKHVRLQYFVPAMNVCKIWRALVGFCTICFPVDAYSRAGEAQFRLYTRMRVGWTS